jgi:hypothetical protein
MALAGGIPRALGPEGIRPCLGAAHVDLSSPRVLDGTYRTDYSAAPRYIESGSLTGGHLLDL